jgi:hypothetical protein
MENEREPTGSASKRPGLATGAFVAAMLTASLISVFYLAWKAAGLPFVPFDVFDWMTRILPGQARVHFSPGDTAAGAEIVLEKDLSDRSLSAADAH